MNSTDVPLWITATHWSARLVLVVLIGLSAWSIATMIQCYRKIQEALGGKEHKSLFNQLQSLVRDRKLSEAIKLSAPSFYQPLLQELSAGTQEPQLIDRSIKSLLVTKRTQIEESLTILATLGSNAPFIGLFGTVLGIIQAFGALGSNQSNASSVMVGISEALVATAVGLFVAIPAVIAFNFLSRQLRVLMTNCESLRDLYISKIR